MTTMDYQWGEKKFSPLELMEEYQRKFPKIVKVVDGFRGNNTWESFSQSEIYLIHCCVTQCRVIAKDPQGRYFSFPTTYDAKFYHIKKNKRTSKEAKPLSKLLKHSLPLDVEVETEESGVLTTGAEPDQSQTLKIKLLTITDTYEERLMKANLIRPEGLNRHVVKIAAYANIKLVVSASEEILQNVVIAAKQIDIHAGEANQYILMFSKSRVENQGAEGIYETLEPTKTLATPGVYETLATAAASSDVVEYATRKSLFSPVVSEITKRKSDKSTTAKPHLPVKPNKVEMRDKPTGISNWKDVPADIRRLSCADVVECLILLNLDKYIQKFKDLQIDGELLAEIDTEMLTNDIKMNGLEAKKLSMFSKDGWRPS